MRLSRRSQPGSEVSSRARPDRPAAPGSGLVSGLALLDLRAAFETVDPLTQTGPGHWDETGPGQMHQTDLEFHRVLYWAQPCSVKLQTSLRPTTPDWSEVVGFGPELLRSSLGGLS